MRSVLRGTVLALGVAGAMAVPAAAYADGEYLRVTPSTIQAGFQIEIEAYCGDNVNPATVSSDAFGVVTITPQTNTVNGKVTHRGTATIPSDTKPSAYRVTLKCPSQQAAATTLHVVNYNLHSKGPKTGGGGLATNDNGGMMVGLGSTIVAAGAVLFVLARRRRATV